MQNKNKMKIMNFRIPKDKYEQEIEPYIEKSGIPTATFIKAATREKIERDNPGIADRPDT